MTDDHDLQGLDPYDLLDVEAARIHRFLVALDAAAWDRPTRCELWSVRDLLGHLRAGEDYHQACLDGRVRKLFDELLERGMTDLATANAIGVADYAAVATGDLIEQWSAVDADTRRRFRERDGGDVDTSVGAYPARWQAFHVAAELATHADDLGVPVSAEEEPGRTRWRAAVSRFAVKESNPGAVADPADGATRYRIGDHEGTVSDADFVELASHRDPRDPSLPTAVREAFAGIG